MVRFCALKGVHWRLRVLLRFRNSEERRNSSEIDDLIESELGCYYQLDGVSEENGGVVEGSIS